MELPPARVKGKASEIQVYNVVGFRADAPELTKPVQAGAPPAGAPGTGG